MQTQKARSLWTGTQKQYKKGQQYEKIVSKYVACSTSAAYIFNDNLAATPFLLAAIGQAAPTLSLLSAACAAGMAVKSMNKKGKSNE
jgi:hypothetical protein